MKVINLSEQPSLLNQYLKEMRSVDIQKDSLRFRRNIERIGEIMAYEISKHLSYQTEQVVTPLAVAEVKVPQDKVVLGTVLRAGLPMHQGFLNMFDHAENAFISAYRKETFGRRGDEKIEIVSEYMAAPSVEGKTLLLVDPMLATGQSLCLTYEALLEKCGKPLHTHIASVVASEQGVDYAVKHLPSKSTTLWVGAVDAELTSRAYIVPGIGDAGDLAFGEKL